VRNSFEADTHQENALVVFCRTCGFHSALAVESCAIRGSIAVW
jgi:hypothetical protein